MDRGRIVILSKSINGGKRVECQANAVSGGEKKDDDAISSSLAAGRRLRKYEGRDSTTKEEKIYRWQDWKEDFHSSSSLGKKMVHRKLMVSAGIRLWGLDQKKKKRLGTERRTG